MRANTVHTAHYSRENVFATNAAIWKKPPAGMHMHTHIQTSAQPQKKEKRND
jgi:hypothetical protein